MMIEAILYCVLGGVSLVHLVLFYKRKRHFEIWQIDPIKFTISSKGGKESVAIQTDKIWFNNASNAPIENIRLKMEKRPSNYYFKPAIDYVETKTEDGTWLMVIPVLEKEQFIELNLFNGSKEKHIFLRDGKPIHIEKVKFPKKTSKHRRQFITFTTAWLAVLLFAVVFAVPYLSTVIKGLFAQ